MTPARDCCFDLCVQFQAQLQQQQSAMVTSVMALLPVMGSAELEAVYRACVALLNRRQSER